MVGITVGVVGGVVVGAAAGVVGVVVGAVGDDDKEHSALRVLGPTFPSSTRLLSCWNFLTAASVFPPKSPSAPLGHTLYPNFISIFCKLVTSDPLAFLNKVADEGLQVPV